MGTILSLSLQEATDALIGNILASDTFVRYRQIQIWMNEDHKAHALLEQLSKNQANLRKKQSNGGVTQNEIDSLRTLQEQVQNNKVIMTYTQSQQEAVNFLREVNNEISQLLGIDFASFANHATC